MRERQASPIIPAVDPAAPPAPALPPAEFIGVAALRTAGRERQQRHPNTDCAQRRARQFSSMSLTTPNPCANHASRGWSDSRESAGSHVNFRSKGVAGRSPAGDAIVARSALRYVESVAEVAIDEALAFAIQLHQAAVQARDKSRLAKARTVYERILEAEPGHPEALHFLGVLLHQSGESGHGLELIARAMLARPNDAMMYNNL